MNHEGKIKDIIKLKHDNVMYPETQLPEIINTILIDFDKVDTVEIVTLLSQYIFYSSKTSKYYMTSDKKQDRLKKYHEKLLNIFNIKINIDEKSKESKKEKPVEIKAEVFKEVENIHKILIAPDNFLLSRETLYQTVKNTLTVYGPFGTQWIHDIQFDDEWDERAVNLSKQFKVLRDIKLPVQRSEAWYQMRNNKITASDGGCVMGQNDHEPSYAFLLKKTGFPPFKSNIYCYHGKKHEEIATMIYEYRMNIQTDEFGLIEHPKYPFLGASPDRIATYYKFDGKHKSKYVGRMLEIKCPCVRKIDMISDSVEDVCPIYYWIQVQLQLECCDLEECDFWQCNIKEYDIRQDFIDDTDGQEPFRSIDTGFEKGCLIQLLPKDKMDDIIKNHDEVMYDDAIFIYPPKIEMSPLECDIWIAQTLANLNTNDKYTNYMFDKVIYWKLVNARNILVNRDKKWFAESLPKLKQMWDYVLFLRSSKDNLKLLNEYITSRKIKRNKDIMAVVNKLYNCTDPEDLEVIRQAIKDAKIEKAKPPASAPYMFVDDGENVEVTEVIKVSPKVVTKKAVSKLNYMFVD